MTAPAGPAGIAGPAGPVVAAPTTGGVPAPVAAPAAVAVLAPFVDARVFTPAEVHLAATIARLATGPVADEVLLAIACAARAPRLGHVCVELDAVAGAAEAELDVADLPWPDPRAWADALQAATEVVADPAGAHDEPLRPLVWDGRRLYLQRYWHHEERAAAKLLARATAAGSSLVAGVDAAALTSSLDALLGPDDPDHPDLQRLAVRSAIEGRLTVVAGGPGTGKTRTVARLVAAAHRLAEEADRDLLVGLAAPTGKAAARMTEAVRLEVAAAAADGAVSMAAGAAAAATTASTVHRLLGWAPGVRFRHDGSNPLPHDLVVVDEVSMVSLPLLARLLDAVRPDAHLVLVGDPDQLVSVEAGTVMGDVVGARAVGPLGPSVVVLERARRFAGDSPIASLAASIRGGDADAVVAALSAGSDQVRWVRDDDVASLDALLSTLVAAGVEIVDAALAGDAGAAMGSATRVKVLAATRRHPLGRDDWGARIEEGVAARFGSVRSWRRWYVGRPVIVGANDDLNGVANGDVGVVVATGDGPMVALAGAGGVRLLPTSRLDQVATWWSMTIHKSQGSEFPHAVVSLPAVDSPVLTRELLYTGVTRAKERVTVVGSEAAIRAAVGRPVRRSSGLRDRLTGA
jgi:exodeoxyribonuclease V alpha subunit